MQIKESAIFWTHSENDKCFELINPKFDEKARKKSWF